MAITIQTQPAPSTPLNLRFDVVYEPREATPPIVGYMVVAVCDDGDERWATLSYDVLGYEADGTVVDLFRGGLADAYVRMATYLRMA